METTCPGVVGTFQYSAPSCDKHPGYTLPHGDDPKARCAKRGGKPDDLQDICPKCNDEIVWVRKRIDVGYFCDRREDEKQIFVSQHHTRCEQWSTLREMLPSRGRAEPQKQPNWGTGRGVAPSLVGTRASRFPVCESEMTRFVNMAYVRDPMFKLY